MTVKILTIILVLVVCLAPSVNAGIYGEIVGLEDLQDLRTFSNQPYYSFDSAFNPVWGNFYAKGGSDKARGGFKHPIYIVPEPVSSILFIAGGVILGFRRFKK